MITKRIIALGSSVSHPFSGGKKAKNVTQKHRPLIWENMLGTVYSMNPNGDVEYHDYDWDAAHKHAEVHNHKDLRIARNKKFVKYSNAESDHNGPRVGKYALWGVPKDN